MMAGKEDKTSLLALDENLYLLYYMYVQKQALLNFKQSVKRQSLRFF